MVPFGNRGSAWDAWVVNERSGFVLAGRAGGGQCGAKPHRAMVRWNVVWTGVVPRLLGPGGIIADRAGRDQL
jgi:hypothetical protein